MLKGADGVTLPICLSASHQVLLYLLSDGICAIVVPVLFFCVIWLCVSWIDSLHPAGR
jgi:hypothetical protein